MISIIICSRNGNISSQLRENIKHTINVEHEIILIDNRDNAYNIFSAYNYGAKKSRYPYLCFMHEDVLYHSKNWGSAVIKHFNKENVGAIGIAGTPYLSFFPAAWWSSGCYYEHILQSEEPEGPATMKTSGPGTREVVAFDGVWFCIRKSLFNLIHFDEETYNSFHFYDMDICMQMYQYGIKMYCVTDVIIQHFSMGNLSSDWVDKSILFRKKWQNLLPASCVKFSYNQQLNMEYRGLSNFKGICQAAGMNSKEVSAMAISNILKFKKGFFFYKAPVYLYRHLRTWMGITMNQDSH